jgi:hypothetical protein
MFLAVRMSTRATTADGIDLSGYSRVVAVIEIDARAEAVVMDCEGCGRPAPLTDRSELRDPEKTAREHSKATGHRCRIVHEGTSYLTLVVGHSRHLGGSMPYGPGASRDVLIQRTAKRLGLSAVPAGGGSRFA